MTAFGKLIRTTAFRLTLVYLFLFALFAASLLGYFAWNTRRMITEQITETVNSELSELQQQYSHSGIRGLVYAIENRTLRPGANLYLLTTPQGQAVAGNIGSLQPGVMSRTGWANTVYHRLDENDSKNHFALVRVTQLSGGFRLLIGRDLEERQRLFGIVANAAQWSLLQRAAERARRSNTLNGSLIRTRMDYNQRALEALNVAVTTERVGFYGPDGRIPVNNGL